MDICTNREIQDYGDIFLNMNQVASNSDNQVFEIITSPGHWILRPILADFLKCNDGIRFEVEKNQYRETKY